ncbi:MAG: signal peptidase II [Proteobacteria bacterium]|nr:signal peptidase II [Pseudomonadota bacterium]
MQPENRTKLFRLLGVVLPLLLLDQSTKALVVRMIRPYEVIPVIPGFFNLTFVCNTGGAFGLAANSAPWVRTALFLGLSMAAACLVLYLFCKTPARERWFSYALCLVLAGAAGNLVDRFRLGEVVDFLQFHVRTLYWPSFNVADSAVSVGVGILVALFVLKKDPF